MKLGRSEYGRLHGPCRVTGHSEPLRGLARKYLLLTGAPGKDDSLARIWSGNGMLLCHRTHHARLILRLQISSPNANRGHSEHANAPFIRLAEAVLERPCQGRFRNRFFAGGNHDVNEEVTIEVTTAPATERPPRARRLSRTASPAPSPNLWPTAVQACRSAPTERMTASAPTWASPDLLTRITNPRALSPSCTSLRLPGKGSSCRR